MIRAGDTTKRMGSVRIKRTCRRERIGTRTFVVTVLTLIVAPSVGFLLLDLDSIFVARRAWHIVSG